MLTIPRCRLLQSTVAGKHLPPLEAAGALGKLADGRTSLTVAKVGTSKTAALHVEHLQWF
jgi:hypothetical protein